MTENTEGAIRILLVDDHSLLRAGLGTMIKGWPGFQLCGEVATIEEARVLAGRIRPDILLVDIDLIDTGNPAPIPELLAAAPGGRVIVLADSRDRDLQRMAVRSGARGVITKDQHPEVLRKAIQKVHAGELWLDRAMVAEVFTEILNLNADARPNPEASRIASLSERECEVIALLCEGLSNQQIAGRLSVTETTVRHHLRSIFDKLDVESRLELVIYAFRHSLATPPR